MAETTLQRSFLKRLLLYSDLGLAIMVIMIVAMMIIPVPTWLLDILLASNITLGVVMLLSTFYVNRALDLAAFPTMLLIVTLFRLALNVSTTRLILLRADAGKVISAFGNFVVGGNYVVGGVVFLILVIIQFIVITKGSERVAEVAARFTLDAMPGKQMAIDADLNAGLIDENVARTRRKDIQREADFYGAMDGASKFVKGDAIAGLIITIINIIGGLAIGVLQRGLTLGEAGAIYSLLTVGDGLVSQIPALLFSTATGVIVTRAAGETNLGRDIFISLTKYSRPLFIGSGLLFALAFIPGLPTIPFLVLGIFLALMGYWVYREGKVQEIESSEGAGSSAAHTPSGSREGATKSAGSGTSAQPVAPASPEDVMQLLTVDPMEIEIGYAIIPLVDPSQGGDMLDRIGTIRKQMALEFGLVVPPIRIRDNIQLKPSEYVIRVRGAETGKGELLPDQYLAMNTGNAEEEIVGVPTVEPAFGLQATWISPELRDKAESMGYTVVDAPSVLATHLSEIIKRYGSELITRQEVQKLTDLVKENSPAVVEEMMGVLSLGEVQKVLQNLVREQIPIRDLVTIFEALADNGRITRSVDYLTERVRESLSRIISLKIQGEEGVATVSTLSPVWEQKIKDGLEGDLLQGWQLNMSPQDIQGLTAAVAKMVEKMAMEGHLPVLLVHPDVRLIVRRILEGSLPGLYVVSYNEISQRMQLKSVGMVE
ncbi:MAG: flagellar biosynthesis protein FlhA [Aminobacterium sp.]|nr:MULTISPECIES: flagellar biosynthesis protein FlhA [unclassified Aminobacterium]MDD2207084.1 flagellar biosynthesis protein FlhA [Aminobacterium sp.]MDD3426819.1 flagellar biosynthesis protein FlhA [Aminobacterium sp.]MDD3707445.1 flagellar biosynthesis protein FlhA [Aminobacterium sp.]MDD4228787.1 flagellar biosynthesis protein FlhA [Aminobacterium sp.]MDD4550594.1 flagellar biosynthesis protein FlhA [Aminobacterium sp.]